MEEGQSSQLGDRDNWRHLYTPLHSLAGSRTAAQGSLANVSSAFALGTGMHTHVTEMSPATWPSEWVEHQTQYGVCKGPPVGTGKAEALRKRTMSQLHREADGVSGNQSQLCYSRAKRPWQHSFLVEKQGWVSHLSLF